MPREPRSLWEVYDSEVPPWRRGRTILLSIGAFHFVLQILVVTSEMMLGNIERIFVFGLVAVFFWFAFYFVWIGVHWIRWVWGAFSMVGGFCWLIWAWRDTSGIETIFATLNLVMGACLCSPSVYFFARHQKQTVRWVESLLFAAGCLLLICNIAAAAVGFWLFREDRQRAACEFANQATQNIYVTWDHDWTAAHVTEESLKSQGAERLSHFLEITKKRLGSVEQVSPATGVVRLRFQLPWRFETDANVMSRAHTRGGLVALHFLLWNSGSGWRIHHLWWDYLPFDGKPRQSPP